MQPEQDNAALSSARRASVSSAWFSRSGARETRYELLSAAFSPSEARREQVIRQFVSPLLVSYVKYSKKA